MDFKNKNNPYKLTDKERVIELIGVTLFAIVFIGSALKLLFFWKIALNTEGVFWAIGFWVELKNLKIHTNNAL